MKNKRIPTIDQQLDVHQRLSLLVSKRLIHLLNARDSAIKALESVKDPNDEVKAALTELRSTKAGNNG